MPDTSWQPADAAAAYNIPEWSEGYGAVGAQGQGDKAQQKGQPQHLKAPRRG